MKKSQIRLQATEALAMDYIKKTIKETGCAPTYAELAAMIGISDAGAFEAVKRLEQKGYIQRNRKPRMMKILK